MNKNIYLVGLFLGFFYSTAYALDNYSCSSKDNHAIEKAIKGFLTQDKSAIPYSDIVVLKKRCVGKYAKATLHPKKPVTDDATLYLKEIKGHWEVISYGTDFSPDFLKTLPPALNH